VPHRLRRYLALAAAAAAVTATGALTTPASALGGESLQCAITPAASTDSHDTFCNSTKTSASYGVTFYVVNSNGQPTSYAWTTPTDLGVQVTAGCTSTSDNCSLRFSANGIDRDLYTSVVLTQGGATETLTARAYVPANCGHYFC
jgi:hypothetical protein